MSTGFPLIVGAGPLPELTMRRACEELAQACRCPLMNVGVGQQPSAVLESRPEENSLVRISGDVARFMAHGESSWLQALSDWRKDVLLLTIADSNGDISGLAPAYAALCRELKVPLLGVVQLQGAWNQQARRRDGLPWWGWVAAPGTNERADGLESLAQRIVGRMPD